MKPSAGSLLLALSVFASSAAWADSDVGKSRNLGLGVGMSSRVNGLSVKLHDRTRSYQMVLGSYGGFGEFDALGERLGGSLDMLSELPRIVETNGLDLAVGAGLGAFGGYDLETEDSWIGAQGILSLQLLIDPLPIDVAGEYRPALVFVPDFEVSAAEFGFHARVWF